VTGIVWGVRSLTRHRLRTLLSVVGIAVTAAMLLDMVMLSGGIEQTFADMLSSRGYQIRVSPKGTLPFDTEASFPDARRVVATLRSDPAVEAAGAVLGASIYGRRSRGRDSLVTLVGYGLQPEAQALYQLEDGADLAPGDTAGVLLGAPAAEALGARIGDTVTLVGQLDPQMAAPAAERRLVVRGIVRWIYDSRGQRSIGTTLSVMQRLAGRAAPDPASIVMVKVRDNGAAAAVAERMRARFPRLEVNSIADLVLYFRQPLVYFRQLSYILGLLSLGVTVLLIATLLTITVNERLGEIATLRAIGVSRAAVVRQVLAEGVALTVVGGTIGVLLGFGTARYLDSILTSFPGLPAAFSFFVPRPDTIATAVVVLLLTGSLAGLYPAWLAARAPIAATLRSEAI
jgi:putative ABC transport system permease protein